MKLIIDPELLKILICPITKMGPIKIVEDLGCLMSKQNVAYRVRNGVPILHSEDCCFIEEFAAEKEKEKERKRIEGGTVEK